MFALNLHDICGTQERQDPFRKIEKLEQIIMSMDNGLIVVLDQGLTALRRCWCMFETGVSVRRRKRIRFYLPSGFDEYLLSQPLELGSLRDCTTALEGDKPLILSHIMASTSIESFDTALSKAVLPIVRTLALLQSAEAGNVAAVEQRLREGTDPNLAMGYGATPLVRAAKCRNWRIVESLVKGRAAVNLPAADGDTPLWAAVSTYNTESVELLLGLKAALDQRRSTDGATPLFMAAQHGHIVLVELLLGAKQQRQESHWNRTPGQAEHVALVKALLGSSMFMSEAEKVAKTPRMEGINLGRTLDGATPLFIAAQQGHSQVVRNLIAALAATDKSTADHRLTPLLAAVEAGHLRVTEALLQGKAAANQGDADGCTPVYVAAMNGHVELTGCLLDFRADTDQASVEYGAAPLFVAAEKGHVDVVELLLQGGAEINKALDKFRGRGSGWTALTVAKYHGHETVTEMLSLAGAFE